MSDAAQSPPAEWYTDPTGRFERRYWSGSAWTEHVLARGVQGIDPLPNATEAQRQRHVESVPSSRREARENQTATPRVDNESRVLPEAASGEPTATESEAESAANAAPKVTQRKIPFFGARKHAEDLRAENERLEALVARYGLLGLGELDRAKLKIEGDIAEARATLSRTRESMRESEIERDEVRGEIVNLRDATNLQEYGVFDFEHPAETSVALATELEALRSDIKRVVRDEKATSATQNFTFNNSTAKGRKFVKDMSKLLLRAYNAEAENCIKTVRAGNLHAAQKRLSTVVDQVERLGGMIDLKITANYHRMRLQELELASRHLQALQAEKELERARREELREQRKAEQELAREKERLQKERSHYANALSALEEKGDLEGAARLRAKLDDVDRAIEDVDYRAANIRAGYVYVISNIGAFGDDVVKIGLTRRLEPMDRVNELGDASVPFRFDVHALFFADDAVSIEAMLHQHFADRRMNKVNLRREYFRARPEEVLDALKEHNVEVLEYTLEPVATEFRASVGLPA